MSAVRSVAIAGAGIGGLTLAAALKRLAPTVETIHVYEKAKELKPALGAGFGLNGGAVLLARLGMADALHPLLTPLERVQVWSVGQGRGISEMDVVKGLQSIKNPADFVHDGKVFVGQALRADIHSILTSRLPPGALKLGQGIEGVEQGPQGAVLRFEGGSTSQPYDLVVGADGIRSAVRRSVFGPHSPKYLGLRIHWGVAEQLVREEPTTVTSFWGSGAAGINFSAGGQNRKDILAIAHRAPEPRPEVWESTEAREEAVGVLKAHNMPDHLVEHAELCHKMFCLGVHQHAPLDTWSKGRVVLVGDSAHATSPFLGQGANQAIQDCYCLAARLGELETKYKSLGEALQAYEAIRKPVTQRIVSMAGVMGRMQTASGWRAGLRDNVAGALLPLFAQGMLQEARPFV